MLAWLDHAVIEAYLWSDNPRWRQLLKPALQRMHERRKMTLLSYDWTALAIFDAPNDALKTWVVTEHPHKLISRLHYHPDLLQHPHYQGLRLAAIIQLCHTRRSTQLELHRLTLTDQELTFCARHLLPQVASQLTVERLAEPSRTLLDALLSTSDDDLLPEYHPPSLEEWFVALLQTYQCHLIQAMTSDSPPALSAAFSVLDALIGRLFAPTPKALEVSRASNFFALCHECSPQGSSMLAAGNRRAMQAVIQIFHRIGEQLSTHPAATPSMLAYFTCYHSGMNLVPIALLAHWYPLRTQQLFPYPSPEHLVETLRYRLPTALPDKAEWSDLSLHQEGWMVVFRVWYAYQFFMAYPTLTGRALTPAEQASLPQLRALISPFFDGEIL